MGTNISMQGGRLLKQSPMLVKGPIHYVMRTY